MQLSPTAESSKLGSSEKAETSISIIRTLRRCCFSAPLELCTFADASGGLPSVESCSRSILHPAPSSGECGAKEPTREDASVSGAGRLENSKERLVAKESGTRTAPGRLAKGHLILHRRKSTRSWSSSFCSSSSASPSRNCRAVSVWAWHYGELPSRRLRSWRLPGHTQRRARPVGRFRRRWTHSRPRC